MLRQDNLYRGEHAIHVHKHHKLGKHRTVIRAALPFINAILSIRQVKQISLGAIYGMRGNGQSGIWFKSQSTKLRVAIGDSHCLQVFQIYPRSSDQVEQIIEILEATARTESIPSSNGELSGHS